MEREEVVIDGDSTDDDEEVTIITPESRKRRRRSNIMVDHDEDEGDEAEQKEKTENQVSSSSSAPRRQQQLLLSENGVSSQPMTLRTPTPTRRSRRNMQQLSITAAVARGERGRRQQQEGGQENAEDEGESEDDDVRIIQPPSATSVGSSGRKNRRPAIQDSDEEMEKDQNEPKENSDGEQEVEIEVEGSSASRRSSRIEHKRQEKEKQHASVRKLDYPVLDNCLDSLQSLGPHYNGGGDDDDDEYKESEPEEHSPPPKKRRRSVPRVGDRDNREKVYADAGDDVDDFICGDDEIEYMNDDEEAVISVESSGDEMAEDDPEELRAMLDAGRSREVSEWFAIYMEYLEECIIDPEFETTMRRKSSKTKYQLYQKAVNHIERKLCSCRDTVRSGVAWPDDMVDALNHASLYRSSHVSAEQDCEACNRRQHVATYHVDLAGYACDATKLYGHNWMGHLKEAVKEAAPVQISFEMGSVCHARTLAYWQMLHAKQFWCIIIDAKRKKCADSSGRIAGQYREEFFKKEFGRFKRLVGLVEKFAEDSKRIAHYMPNEWKRITRRNVTSDFLPLASRASYRNSESRRGTLDAFVGESEEEETEDEEEVMEKTEQEKRAATVVDNDDDQATDDEEEAKDLEIISPRRTPRSESTKEQKLQLTSNEEQKQEEPQVKDEKAVPEKDIDDLMCLVCDASPRNAGIVHGLYLHVYCCYACAKRQHRMKCGCMVCNRPIDRVLRLLPLTLDARKAIRNQQKNS
ncbi:E3 ubiquitin-protein ligase Mdm2 [Phytophthora nicotianae]|uniref:E3 ubiquitin-protein ligase Mdm2 n=1 Tax=Phytophthora nicotianae TaxID=4792 RepID=A0A0W8C743_PHYNI|nr:E3 ubiquitin-protein ligase Mdm2 [Phytophthora nicotianae]